MMNPKLYLETTIISYLISRPSRDLVTAAHQQITQAWWDEQRQHFDLYISQFVLQEAGAGDSEAVQRRLRVVDGIPLLELSDEVPVLARALIEGHAVPPQAIGDAFHIAIATVRGIDFLLTWNMKHLANAAMRNAIAAICLSHSYAPPVICTPEELSEDLHDVER